MKVGPYELVETTGARGVMSIHAGTRVRDGLPVTVNVLPKQHLSDDLLRRRLKREFKAARSIDSPHVVKYLDLVETDDAVGVVTERLPVMNLRSHLSLAPAVSCDEAIEIAKQIALALHDCHRSGVVHRSVTPENIYIADDSAVTIANFGLASMHTATTLTMTGTMLGDPEYAPPENLFAAPRDIRGDIYSFGVVLWEVLTGHNPFEGDNLTEIIQKKRGDSLPPPSGVNPDVPHWLDVVVGDMTAADPDKRPASLHQIIAALNGKTHIKRAIHNDGNNCRDITECCV